MSHFFIFPKPPPFDLTNGPGNVDEPHFFGALFPHCEAEGRRFGKNEEKRHLGPKFASRNQPQKGWFLRSNWTPFLTFHRCWARTHGIYTCINQKGGGRGKPAGVTNVVTDHLCVVIVIMRRGPQKAAELMPSGYTSVHKTVAMTCARMLCGRPY